MVHAVVAHPVFQIAEVAAHKREVVLRLCADVGLCVGVLVETVQMACAMELAQDLAAVASTAKGHVHIDATLVDGQSADALLEEHGHMICLGRIGHCRGWLLSFSLSAAPGNALPIRSSRAWAKASASMNGPSPSSPLQISMASSMPMKRTCPSMPAICW